MNEFIGCVYSNTSTACLKVVDTGSSFFSSFVSQVSSKCGPFIQTNATWAYEAIFSRAELDFSVGISNFTGNCAAQFKAVTTLVKCGSDVLQVIVSNDNARQRLIGIGILGGAAGVLGLMAGGLAISYARHRGYCRFSLFPTRRASTFLEAVTPVRPAAAAPTASETVSGHSSAAEETDLLIPKGKRNTK